MTEKKPTAATSSSDASITERQGGDDPIAKEKAATPVKPKASTAAATSEPGTEPSLAELNVEADAKQTIDEKQAEVRAEHASAADQAKAKEDAEATAAQIKADRAQKRADAKAAKAGKRPDASDPEIAEKERGAVRGHDTRSSVTDLAPGSDVADQEVENAPDEPDYLVSPPQLYEVKEDTTIPNLCEKLGINWRPVARDNGYRGGQFDVAKGTKLRMPAGYSFK